MRLRLSFLCLLCCIFAQAQIPYYAPTTGHGNLNGYTSLKFRPGENRQETYTNFFFGITDYAATGLDLYTCGSEVYGGLLFRGGIMPSRYFGIGLMAAPSFRVDDNMRFSYLTTALFMNGDILDNGKLFWAANTWYTANRGKKDAVDQYAYLGSTIALPRGQSITPMAGVIYPWLFDRDADLALGAYWTVGKFCFYLWSNDLLKSHPRMVIGLEFTIPAL